MTIGLVLLALVAIMLFFGLGERIFRKIGVKNWLAFVLVLSLVVGAIVPSIRIGAFSMNVGAFIVPTLIAVTLFVLSGLKADLVRGLFATLAVAAVAVATRMLIEPLNAGLILASSLIVGFVGGAVAFLIGQSRISTLAAAMGGIILGDVIIGFLYTFAIGGYGFSLGSYGVFDSLIIASVFGVVMAEVVAAIKRSMSLKRVESTALSTEAGEDVEIYGATTDEHSDQADLTHNKRESHKNTPDTGDDFFDDFV